MRLVPFGIETRVQDLSVIPSHTAWRASCCALSLDALRGLVAAWLFGSTFWRLLAVDGKATLRDDTDCILTLLCDGIEVRYEIAKKTHGSEQRSIYEAQTPSGPGYVPTFSGLCQERRTHLRQSSHNSYKAAQQCDGGVKTHIEMEDEDWSLGNAEC